MAKSFGSKLDEAIGNAIERAIFKKFVQEFGAAVVSEKVKDGYGNSHQIDLVIKDQKGQPVILMESKYLRYTKHNWDKGSRLCIAHYLLRKSIKTIRKSIAILAGNWTDNSIEFIKSMGIEVYRVPFEKISEVLTKYGIDSEWEEKDDLKPKKAWNDFEKLTEEEKNAIGPSLIEGIEPEIRKSVMEVLSGDFSKPRGISEIELSIRTSYNEFITIQFETVNDVLKYLIDLQSDKEDITDKWE